MTGQAALKVRGGDHLVDTLGAEGFDAMRAVLGVG